MVSRIDAIAAIQKSRLRVEAPLGDMYELHGLFFAIDVRDALIREMRLFINDVPSDLHLFCLCSWIVRSPQFAAHLDFYLRISLLKHLPYTPFSALSRSVEALGYFQRIIQNGALPGRLCPQLEGSDPA